MLPSVDVVSSLGDAGTGTGGTSSSAGKDIASCKDLGATACQGESCCASPLVPGCSGCSTPMYEFTLDDFLLDKYEVTVGRFRNFVAAYQGPPAPGAGAHPEIADSGWVADWDDLMAANAADLVGPEHVGRCATTGGTWTDAPGENEQKPINCVTWYEAFAFCAWDGGFLPSEFEWQWAAAGGFDDRRYPWPEQTLDHDHALYCATPPMVEECSATTILDVGSKPAGESRWGQQDLLGSMWEWILDHSGSNYPSESPCVNCADVATNGDRVIRGASWYEDSSWLDTARRHQDPPNGPWWNVGIRCARTPP